MLRAICRTQTPNLTSKTDIKIDLKKERKIRPKKHPKYDPDLTPLFDLKLNRLFDLKLNTLFEVKIARFTPWETILFFGGEKERKIGPKLQYFFSLFSLFGGVNKGIKACEYFEEANGVGGRAYLRAIWAANF